MIPGKILGTREDREKERERERKGEVKGRGGKIKGTEHDIINLMIILEFYLVKIFCFIF